MDRKRAAAFARALVAHARELAVRTGHRLHRASLGRLGELTEPPPARVPRARRVERDKPAP